MSNQIDITGGARVRGLNGVITGTSGVLNSLPINVANGIPQLDINGKILVSQLPNSVMEFLGTWNAATNTPTLADGIGNAGDVYLCNVAGTVNFGSGPIVFNEGDYVVYSGSTWERSGGALGTVTSVAASINGNAVGITGSPITTAGTLAFAFAGTNLQYVNGAGNLTTFPTLITSIGLSMPTAFNVANSPLTANGTIAVTGAGTASQYIRGDGQLATFPTTGGGGSAIYYYFNGSINSTVTGYKQLSNTAIVGAGTDFNISGNGLIAQFLTDVGNPNRNLIPSGAWNFEVFFSSSSNGGNEKFYLELVKYNGSTFTTIASTVTNPEAITGGTTTDLYITSMAVPETTILVTDRLAIRVYVVDNSGARTITLHTEDNNLCQITTTFSAGISSINGLTENTQYFAVGTSGMDFNINSLVDTHTFNLPTASATNRGALSSADWTMFNNKLSTSTAAATYVPYTGATANVDLGVYSLTSSAIISKSVSVVINGTASSPLILKTGTSGLSFASDAISLISSPTSANTLSIYFDVATVKRQANFNANSLTATRTYTLPDATGTLALTSDLTSFITLTSLSASSPLAYNNTTGAFSIQVANTSQNGYLSSTDWNTFNGKQNALTNPVTGTGTTNYVPKFTGASAIGNSAIYDNGTNVLIGTATSSSFLSPKLAIYDGNYTVFEIRANTEARIALTTNTTGTTPFTEIYNSYGSFAIKQNYTGGSTYPLYYEGASHYLFMQTNGVQAIRVFSNQNVLLGTGTTDAGFKLDVSGTLRVTGASTLTGRVTGVEMGVGRDGSDSVAAGPFFRWTNAAVDRQMLTQLNASNGLTTWAFNGTSWASIYTLASTGAATFSSSVTAGGGINAGDSKFYNSVQLTDSLGGTSQAFLWTDAANTLKIGTGTVSGANVKMTITSGGNVGIGTSSPNAKLNVVNDDGVGSGLHIIADFNRNTSSAEILLGYYADGTNVTGPVVYAANSMPLLLAAGGSERLRITSGGNVLIGQTAASGSVNGIYFRVGIESGFIVTNDNALQLSRYSSNGDIETFFRDASKVGSISVTTTATAFNTSSDYRLKEDFKDFNALDIMSKIKFYDFKWKLEDSRMVGVKAHELKDIIPYAVNGEKDGIDEKGNPTYQGVDYSKLVAIQGKAIQELSAQIEELKALINK